MSGRHRPARQPAPLRYHFWLTAGIAASFLFTAIVLIHEGDPAILGASVVGASGLRARMRRGHESGARRRGNAAPLVDFDLAALVAAGGHTSHRRPSTSRARVARIRLGRAREQLWRAVFLTGRWLIADQHAVTVLQLAAVLTVIGVAVAASPAGLAIPAATVLLGVAVVGLVLAVVHRNDPPRAGSVLGGKGGVR